MQSFFIWKNRDCRSMGIYLTGPVAIVRPEERVNHVQIPGTSGDMTQTEGENIFNSYIQTAEIHVKSGMRVRTIFDWLRGDGYVTFSGEPDRRQKARIIGAVTLNKVSRNIDTWVGSVQFYCQPLKEKLTEETLIVTASGAGVRNSGDVTARPLYKVTASGSSISVTVTGERTPEDNTIAVTGLQSGQVIWIDSQVMEILNTDRTATLTENSAGEFPVLGAGNNTITFTGCSQIEITKRERFL